MNEVTETCEPGGKGKDDPPRPRKRASPAAREKRTARPRERCEPGGRQVSAALAMNYVKETCMRGGKGEE
jgi:hypothetical protein